MSTSQQNRLFCKLNPDSVTQLMESINLIQDLGNKHGTIELKFVGNDKPYINIKEIKLPNK